MTVVRRSGEYRRRVHKWIVGDSRSNDKPLMLQEDDIILSDDGYELSYLRRVQDSEGKASE